MGSFTVIGFFALTGGKRIVSTKSSKLYYCFYTTTIQCSAGVDIPAEIRIYSPYNDVPHPDDTIAFVIARAYCPLNNTALLNAYHLIPVPGNPTETEYQLQRVPDCPYPFVSGTGAVSGTEILADGITKSFSVVVSDYVRDSTKSSTVQYAFFILWPLLNVLICDFHSGVLLTALAHDGPILPYLMQTQLFIFSVLSPTLMQQAPFVSILRMLI